jgi:hypothetical protein
VYIFKNSNQHLGNRSRGASIVSFISVFIIIAFAGLVVARSMPAWVEYSAIKRAAHRMEANNEQDPVTMLKIFDAAVNIDNITSISSKDLIIEKEGDRSVVHFSYSTRTPLVSNASLTFDFVK